MSQYAKELPVDKNNNPYICSSPNFPAVQSWGSVFTVASTVGLSDKTTVVQFLALGQPALIKWGNTAVTSANFDCAIPPNYPVNLVIPQSVFGVGAASLMGANGQNGLYNMVNVKQVAIAGSVFACEF